jgi:Protein of unknown function (DUF2924)
LDGLARHGGSPRRHLKLGTVLVRDYQGQRHTVTVVSDGFDWQGTTYPSLSAIARAITGTAWSGPRFFALARRNGTRPRSKNRKSVPGDRNSSHAARGLNNASVPLQRHRRRKPIGIGRASLLERLSQTCAGLLSNCATCGVLDGRAHRLPPGQQGHRQSPAPAAQSMKRPARRVGPERKACGYEVGKGEYPVVSDEELDAIEIAEHPYDRDRQLCAARADRRAFLRHSLLHHPERAGRTGGLAVIREAMRRKLLRVAGRAPRRRPPGRAAPRRRALGARYRACRSAPLRRVVTARLGSIEKEPVSAPLPYRIPPYIRMRHRIRYIGGCGAVPAMRCRAVPMRCRMRCRS